MNLIYKQIDKQKFNVLTPNDHLVGELIMDVDGYFYFWEVELVHAKIGNPSWLKS